MRSKEAIRNRILSYTNQIWGTKKIERLDTLIQILIDELVNELYLVQNRLYDIEFTIQNNISRGLTEEKHIAVRPAHTVLQVTPGLPTIELSKDDPFTLSEAPVGFISKEADAFTFHSLINVRLFNLKVDYLFHYRQLYAIDAHCGKQLITSTAKQSSHNSVWLGIAADSAIDNLKDLSFFVDFPKLSEIDELFDVLCNTECWIGGKQINLTQGIQGAFRETLSTREKNILKLYHNHYLFIDEVITLNDIQKEKLPVELEEIIHSEKIGELKPMYWIKLVFNPAFTAEHLMDMIVAVNTFPVLNQKLEKTTIIRDNFSKMVPLEAGIGEKFLTVEYARDDRGQELVGTTSVDRILTGSYYLKTLSLIFSEEFSLKDFIRLLLDRLEEERTAFVNFDKEKITSLLTSLLETNLMNKVKSEIKREEVARILIEPHEKVTHVNVGYWLTYGELLNGIRAGKTFLPDKNSQLDGYLAISLCDIHGAKEFTDVQELITIDRFVFNSRDQVITEYDIVSFCYSELGKAVEKVEFKLTQCVSIKSYEGVVRVLEISLTPSSHLLPAFDKGTLKSLITRLKERSPNDYNYRIKIVNE